MEFRLDGDPTVYLTPEGRAFIGGLNGSCARDVEVLLDGRAGMTLPHCPLRIVTEASTSA